MFFGKYLSPPPCLKRKWFLFLWLCTPGVTETSISVEVFQSVDCSSTVARSDGEDFKEHTDTETAAEQPRSQESDAKAQKEEQQVLINPTCAKDHTASPCQQQTGQLVKEVRW